MKNIIIFFSLVFFILFSNNSFTLDYYLIIPGVSAGLFQLGKPIPNNADRIYGKPINYIPPDESEDSGIVEYKDGILIKLNDNKSKNNIYSIYITNNNSFKTTNGIKIGCSFHEVLNKFPIGKFSNDVNEADYEWALNSGLAIFFSKDKVIRFCIFK